MQRVTMRNMVFYAHHGAHPQEQELGQRFYVDVELWGDYSAAMRTDDLHEAVNYVEVYSEIKRVVEGRNFKLLEALGGAVADALLARFASVRRTRVVVRKPGALVPGPIDHVEFEATKER